MWWSVTPSSSLLTEFRHQGLISWPPDGDGCVRQVCSWWPYGGRALDRAPLRSALLLDNQGDGSNCQCWFASYGDDSFLYFYPAFLTPTEFRHTGLNCLPPNGGFLHLFVPIRRVGVRPNAPTYGGAVGFYWARRGIWLLV